MFLAMRRAAYRAAFQLLRVWWFVARPHTQGVKLAIWSGQGQVLFVRHTYGDRRVWELPGGGRRRGESAEDAARREAGEELGLQDAAWTSVDQIVSREHATAHLTVVRCAHDGSPLHVCRVEIAETRWCDPSRPPQPLGRHAAEILALPAFSWEAA
ncbi:MAG: mismatch repair protein MutT [Solirubrobacterales bacterium]|nr:mismatch repair protein MutT [Solirubrobacterales bacterium]